MTPTVITARTKPRFYASKVMYPNCKKCRTEPLTTDADRELGLCLKCRTAPRTKRTSTQPLTLSRRPHAVTKMKDQALQSRIDAIVERAQKDGTA